MISSFDLNKLNYLLQDFYNLTHIRITVFDDSFHELAAYPEQISPFCKLIRSDVNGQRECSLCDENACKTAAKHHSPYTYCCHAGLTESIVPIHLGNIVIGYLLFGQVFCYDSHEEGWRQIRAFCKNYRIDTYISEHFADELDAQTLCEHFRIGKTKLYEIAKQNYGTGKEELMQHAPALFSIRKSTLILKKQLTAQDSQTAQ